LALPTNRHWWRPVRASLAALSDDTALAEADVAALKARHLFLSRALDGDLVFPDFPAFAATLDEAFALAAQASNGAVATYIPQLARVNPDQFGAACCSIDAQQWARGDHAAWFSLQSVSKAITYALVLEEHGTEYVHRFVGREPSGAGFNERVLNADGLPHNPLINSGAIMCCALVKPDLHVSHRFEFIMDTWQRLCGGARRPQFNNATFLSERDTADRNFCLAYMMREENVFPPGTNLQTTLELYFMICSIELNCDMLAVAAATLASGGVCPLSGERVFSEQTVRNALSVTASCGMYDASGQFCFDIGFPAKSGVAGGLLIVIPGRCGFATFSPRVEGRGNSVRGVAFCEQISPRCDFHQYSIRGALRQQSVATIAERARLEIADDADPLTRLSSAAPAALARNRTARQRAHGTARSAPHRDAPRNTRDAVDAVRLRMRTELMLFVEKINNELLFAACRNDLDHVRTCVARGANVNYQDYDRNSALHVAASEGHADVIAYLLAHGAERAATDRRGRLPIDGARRGRHARCIALLEQVLEYAQEYDAIAVDEEALFETPDQSVPRLFAALDDGASGRVPATALQHALRRVGFGEEHSVALHRLHDELDAMRELDAVQFSRLIAAQPVVRVAIENTNALPDWQQFAQHVTAEFASLANETGGQLSRTSETYLRADPNKWALALCSTTGQQLLLGDYNERFCVDSCGKLVPYLIALELLGAAEVHKYVGKEPNGRNFNDLALDKNNRPHSPVLNAGAMMVAALIKPDEPMAARFAYVRGVWERLVGGTAVGFDNEAYLARLDKGMRCWTLAYMMFDSNAFPPHVKRGTPLNETVELFFMLTSLTCTAQQLAIASATLSNGGVNPLTGERVFERAHVQNCLSLMASCGLYDNSGEFFFNVGMPAKSGAAGGLMAVAPTTMGMCSWSPRIDAQGISVRGAKLMHLLTHKYNFHVYDILVRNKVDPTLHRGTLEDEHVADLMFSAARGDTTSVLRVLSLGISANAPDYDGRRALHIAAAEGQLEVCKLLQENGASADLPDRWGATALQEAKPFPAIVQLLTPRTPRGDKKE
jgi:glutaminase